MENYITMLESRYSDIMKELSGGDSGPMGAVIGRIHDLCKSRDVDTSKAEIRDALIIFAAKEKLRIEKHIPRRLQVIFE